MIKWILSLAATSQSVVVDLAGWVWRLADSWVVLMVVVVMMIECTELCIFVVCGRRIHGSLS